MTWEPPAFTEINMSAEIGGYGSDFTDPEPSHPARRGGEAALTQFGCDVEPIKH